MLDTKSLKKTQASREAALARAGQSGTDFKFKWMRAAQLENGTYTMRILPRHPEKCPKGFHLYSTHGVEKIPTEAPTKVLCTESYDPGAPCFLCDVVDAIYEGNVLNKLPESVKGAINRLRPWRRVLIPTTWYVRSEVITSGGRENTKFYPDDSEEKGIIFEVTADTLIDRIVELNEMHPNLSLETDQGYYMTFNKQGNKYKLRLGEQMALQTPSLIEDYPALTKFGTKFRMDDAQTEALCMSTWWWKHVDPYIDFSGD
jgi:hypothetical protein